jgi:hypothetical protein
MGSPPPNEQQRLAALNALDILDTEYEQRFDRITRLAQRLFGTEIAAVTLVDESRQWFKSRQGPLESEGTREDSFCAKAIQSPDETMVIGDASLDPRFAKNALVTGTPPGSTSNRFATWPEWSRMRSQRFHSQSPTSSRACQTAAGLSFSHPGFTHSPSASTYR